MNTKTLTRILTIILIVAVLLIQLGSSVMATDFSKSDSIQSFIKTNAKEDTGLGDAANSIGGAILGVVRIIGNFIAIGFLIWLGIKWVMASAQEKADLKKNMWSYVIGVVLIFGAANIIPWIVTLATNL